MTADRTVYAQKALRQIHRLLGNLDRNPESSTYGCMDRSYWHDKATDFADIDNQFGVHALALVYKHDFPNSPFKGNPQIKEWAIAAMNFWASRQHSDGSFDEHYPFERGWVGPTAFSAYTCAEAYELLRDEIPPAIAERVQQTMRKAALRISRGQTEDDHLANHHAMACLAVWKVAEVLKDKSLGESYARSWKGFLSYHNAEEGWSREYDGPDPGYLSATVSFLGKIYQKSRDPELLRVMKQSAEFCSYFVYPDGTYAGCVGSRSTIHFYPHGFELLARDLPIAATVAERMLQALGEDKLVPPEIMPDRYMAYRLPEYLLAYLDYATRPAELVRLPCESEPFSQYFPDAGIHISNQIGFYLVSALSKGGAYRLFDKKGKRLLSSDAGILMKLADGTLATSQWASDHLEATQDAQGWAVKGPMHVVASQKRFTLLTFLLFRTTLFVFGWSAGFSYWLKRKIRQAIILKSKRLSITFTRTLKVEPSGVSLTDTIDRSQGGTIERLSLGSDFAARHVPQSGYFQTSALLNEAYRLNKDELATLNTSGKITIRRNITIQ